jgi:hypothetical protein
MALQTELQISEVPGNYKMMPKFYSSNVFILVVKGPTADDTGTPQP